MPFLNTPLVPVLFVASALATGAAALTVIGFFRSMGDEVAEGLDSLLRLDMALVAVEALAVAGFVAVSLLGDPEAARSARQLLSRQLLSGSSSMLFWLGV
ncbi:NrfD/PsrC family molybdoenzyme membrane anchor subunit, partial [Eggerthella sinensis]|uniref:NrfD/PsrC family molybdoenzyme membrane anchor subunit n=1 Tax=Eggerthella sinensis TaxID=242230 RepID=UPI0022E5DB77